jgi:hypothetical protein
MTRPIDDNQPPWRARAIVRLRQYLGTLPNYAAARSELDQTWEETIASIGRNPKLLLILEGIASDPRTLGSRHSQMGSVMQIIAKVVLQEILIREIGSATNLAGGQDSMEPEDDPDIPF